MSDSVSSLEARYDITEAMSRYCRSLDRMDRDLMATVFHPTATVKYPKFEGAWSEFVDWVWDLHRDFERHSHQMSNVMIGLAADGLSAVSESYVAATLWKSATGSPTVDFAVAPDSAGGTVTQTSGTVTEVRARYLDDWSLVAGHWAIDHRECVVDIKTEVATTGLIGEGRRDLEDPSYRTGIVAHLRRGKREQWHERIAN